MDTKVALWVKSFFLSHHQQPWNFDRSLGVGFIYPLWKQDANMRGPKVLCKQKVREHTSLRSQPGRHWIKNFSSGASFRREKWHVNLETPSSNFSPQTHIELVASTENCQGGHFHISLHLPFLLGYFGVTGPIFKKLIAQCPYLKGHSTCALHPI